jgi:hypothetical protein
MNILLKAPEGRHFGSPGFQPRDGEMYISFSATYNLRTANNICLALLRNAFRAYVLRIAPNISSRFCKRLSRRKKYSYFKYPELKLRATSMSPLWGYQMHFISNAR